MSVVLKRCFQVSTATLLAASMNQAFATPSSCAALASEANNLCPSFDPSLYRGCETGMESGFSCKAKIKLPPLVLPPQDNDNDSVFDGLEALLSKLPTDNPVSSLPASITNFLPADTFGITSGLDESSDESTITIGYQRQFNFYNDQAKLGISGRVNVAGVTDQQLFIPIRAELRAAGHEDVILDRESQLDDFSVWRWGGSSTLLAGHLLGRSWKQYNGAVSQMLTTVSKSSNDFITRFTQHCGGETAGESNDVASLAACASYQSQLQGKRTNQLFAHYNFAAFPRAVYNQPQLVIGFEKQSANGLANAESSALSVSFEMGLVNIALFRLSNLWSGRCVESSSWANCAADWKRYTEKPLNRWLLDHAASFSYQYKRSDIDQIGLTVPADAVGGTDTIIDIPATVSSSHQLTLGAVLNPPPLGQESDGKTIYRVDLAYSLQKFDNLAFRQDREVLRFTLTAKRGELAIPFHFYYREKGEFSNSPINGQLGGLIGLSYAL